MPGVFYQVGVSVMHPALPRTAPLRPGLPQLALPRQREHLDALVVGIGHSNASVLDGAVRYALRIKNG